MSPEDVKNLRKDLGITAKDLAEALKIDAETVRAWERGEQFPTRASCEAMEKLRANPPPRRAPKGAGVMAVLRDPRFFALLRKLLAHPKLRAEVDKLAEGYPDPED